MRVMKTLACLVLVLAPAGASAQPADPGGTLDRNRARMYRQASAAIWRAAQDAIKSINLTTPRIAADAQLLVAFQGIPAGTPERRSELRVFVSPFAEPARVYVGSVMRTPDPNGDPRAPAVRYNTGELEASFFTALERAIKEQGQPIPLAAPERAALAHRLLGAADPCLARIEDDEPLALNPETGFLAPEKIRESDAVPVYPAGARDRNALQARIDATITEDGALVGGRLIQTRGVTEAFSEAVLGAASLWHYVPVKVDGCRVPVRLTLAVQFSPK